jgi:hypothetical protein
MGDSGAGKKAKSGIIADWDATVTKIFCKICVEEIESGNRSHDTLHDTLTVKGYTNLVVLSKLGGHIIKSSSKTIGML